MLTGNLAPGGRHGGLPVGRLAARRHAVDGRAQPRAHGLLGLLRQHRHRDLGAGGAGAVVRLPAARAQPRATRSAGCSSGLAITSAPTSPTRRWWSPTRCPSWSPSSCCSTCPTTARAEPADGPVGAGDGAARHPLPAAVLGQLGFLAGDDGAQLRPAGLRRRHVSTCPAGWRGRSSRSTRRWSASARGSSSPHDRARARADDGAWPTRSSPRRTPCSSPRGSAPGLAGDRRDGRRGGLHAGRAHRRAGQRDRRRGRARPPPRPLPRPVPAQLEPRRADDAGGVRLAPRPRRDDLWVAMLAVALFGIAVLRCSARCSRSPRRRSPTRRPRRPWPRDRAGPPSPGRARSRGHRGSRLGQREGPVHDGRDGRPPLPALTRSRAAERRPDGTCQHGGPSTRRKGPDDLLAEHPRSGRAPPLARLTYRRDPGALVLPLALSRGPH